MTLLAGISATVRLEQLFHHFWEEEDDRSETGDQSVVVLCQEFMKNPAEGMDRFIEGFKDVKELHEELVFRLRKENFFEFIAKIADKRFPVASAEKILCSLAQIRGVFSTEMLNSGCLTSFVNMLKSSSTSREWKRVIIVYLLYATYDNENTCEYLVQAGMIDVVTEFFRRQKANVMLSLLTLRLLSRLTSSHSAKRWKREIKATALIMVDNWNIYNDEEAAQILVFVARAFAVPDQEFATLKFVENIKALIGGPLVPGVVDAVLKFLTCRSQYLAEATAFYASGMVDLIERLPKDGVNIATKFEFYSMLIVRVPEMSSRVHKSEIMGHIIECAGDSFAVKQACTLILCRLVRVNLELRGEAVCNELFADFLEAGESYPVDLTVDVMYVCQDMLSREAEHPHSREFRELLLSRNALETIELISQINDDRVNELCRSISSLLSSESA